MSKTLTKVRVDCSDLAFGMYICELDRPWLDTPFMIQGFYIKNLEDVETVRNICDYVYIDKIVDRAKLTNNLVGASSAIMFNTGAARPTAAGPVNRVSRPAEDGGRKQPARREQGIENFFPGRQLAEYADEVSWREEAPRAGRAIKYLYDYIIKFMELNRQGDRLVLHSIDKAVEPMVESVIRNPDACLWCTTMKPPSDDAQAAALRASVLAVVLGRQLKLPKSELRSLAIGGLLFDIGKTRLDDCILQADRKLNEREMSEMQRHVEIGLDLVRRSGLRTPDIIDFIEHHHERLDGSGYPRGLAGDDIPAFGRIAGLVDCYNAITGNRRYASTRSPAEAITLLYKLKGVHFHTDLIEEFIQAIGVYPVGAMVELANGEVAIVVAQSRTRRLRPTVALLLDANLKPVAEGRYVELEKITRYEDGSKLDIVKNLEPNAFGIDRAAIRLR
jgi:HD-GYP domain-containing protein (c-di-GMP phosphodiesterase class II)